ncbi:MAG: hypothetical protein A4E62_01631 [Syntrophorhabdus sp. PtaU1.Bin002]|nr:MAG: hypothetical protein A4E62_01631 [Syntrophorhabdus sp. PtaU1.Bin002]
MERERNIGEMMSDRKKRRSYVKNFTLIGAAECIPTCDYLSGNQPIGDSSISVLKDAIESELSASCERKRSAVPEHWYGRTPSRIRLFHGAVSVLDV